MGSECPKQYLPLLDRPLIWHALRALCAEPAIQAVFVVLAAEDADWPTATMAALGPKLQVLRCGGATRADSVRNGLRAMVDRLGDIADDWVLVHDAARPCLSETLIDELLRELANDAVGGLLAMPVVDTLKRADDALRSVATVPRIGLWQAQTPQIFRHGGLLNAFSAAGGPAGPGPPERLRVRWRGAPSASGLSP